MSRRAWAMLLLVCLPAASSIPARPAQPGQYHEFWVWGGVDPSPQRSQARRWYLLQGAVGETQGAAVFTRQGWMPTGGFGEVVLAYRLQTLAWNRLLLDTWLMHIQAWEHQGNTVAGIQLDFDARTRKLAHYAEYLRQVRLALPKPYALSVTGLLDWATGGDPAELDALRGVVDEVVFQTYQGTHTIPRYPAYLHALAKLRLPFKIGLVEQGDWDTRHERELARSPHYRGAVVFLLPRKR